MNFHNSIRQTYRNCTNITKSNNKKQYSDQNGPIILVNENVFDFDKYLSLRIRVSSVATDGDISYLTEI